MVGGSVDDYDDPTTRHDGIFVALRFTNCGWMTKIHIKSCFDEEKNGEEYVSPGKRLFFNKIYYQ